MNPDRTNEFHNDKKISIDQMLSLIEETLTPFDSMPDKTKISEEQVLRLYQIITEADELFRMLTQIAELKKAIDELTK